MTAALCRCVSLYAAVCGGCGAALGLLWLVGHLYVLTHTLDPELRTHRWGRQRLQWVGNGDVYKFICSILENIQYYNSPTVQSITIKQPYFFTNDKSEGERARAVTRKKP